MSQSLRCLLGIDNQQNATLKKRVLIHLHLEQYHLSSSLYRHWRSCLLPTMVLVFILNTFIGILVHLGMELFTSLVENGENIVELLAP